MTEKICMFCPHFEYDRIREYSCSTMTGGTEGGFSCSKNHYLEVQPWDNNEFRKLILKAETCPDYEVEALSK